jgi:hypothetical protein
VRDFRKGDLNAPMRFAAGLLVKKVRVKASGERKISAFDFARLNVRRDAEHLIERAGFFDTL